MDRTAYGSTGVATGNDKWFYVVEGKKQGPIEASKLASVLASGKLDPETRVWKTGMDSWQKASETELFTQAGDTGTAGAAKQDKAGKDGAKGKPRWWIWLIIAAAVIGIAVACFFLFGGKDGADSTEEETVTYTLQEFTVYEDDACAFIIDDIGEKGDYLELDVRCVNKTEEVLTFSWESTCINGSMFDPLWDVLVMGKSTVQSSITFPLSDLELYDLLPADQIKFVLRVVKEFRHEGVSAESLQFVTQEAYFDETVHIGYKKVEGYDGYLFGPDVQVDEEGRPYFISSDANNIHGSEENRVYFDELYDLNGQRLYPVLSDGQEFVGFYGDPLGRPYYFNDNGETVYYDGYGYAFRDNQTGKYYFYDETGKAAYYGNGGNAEYFDGKITETMLKKGKTEELVKAAGPYLVHKEFAIYPTGKTAEEITRPNRVLFDSERVYWDGDKGKFIVLGGEMDEFTGYVVHVYMENNSDNYICLGWSDHAVVNGVEVVPDSIAVLRPNSAAYRQIVIPASVLKANKIKTVERIDFRVFAVGEDISVPLYPIEWAAVTLTDPKK